ncbi:uncharacterized protein LOC124925497 isoform X3 [Impatiens glandulifera]|uniref:uncharacterized protein LOC124925497 isoform X3 n=1 Tax=Impatiens glandulifera TaxID=253017 RepID=UPI001FB145EB|nr:uncharacterized protein LOC124925497 isoform X3 [Impatiens glandulifera]
MKGNYTTSSLKSPADALERPVKVDELISSSTDGQTSSNRIVFFDNDIGIWKCRCCSWTYRKGTPWIDHIQDPTRNPRHRCIFCEIRGGEFKHLFSDIGPNDVQGLVFEKNVGDNGLFSTSVELDAQRIQSNGFNHQNEENHIDASNLDLGVQPVEKSSNGYSMNTSSPEITAASDEGSLMKETDSEKTEYDVERVLEKQNTHDLYCPNCRSCITRRVILRKRKRTVSISKELETEIVPYLDLDPTEDQGGKALDNKRLATTEKVTIHEGGSSSAANDSDRDNEPEMFRCLSCFSFFIPTGNGFRLFNLPGEKIAKENREKIDTISAPRKAWWHFMFHSDKVPNSETDNENLQKGDIGTSSELLSPSDSSNMPAKEETNKTELHDGIRIVPYPAKAPELFGKVIFNAGEKPDGAMDNGRAKEETNKTELHDGTIIVPFPAKAPGMIGKVIFNAGEKPDGAMDNDRGNEETNKTELHDGTSVLPYPAKAPEMIGKVTFNAGEKSDGAMDNDRANEETNKTELHDGTSIMPYPAKASGMIGKVIFNAGEKPDGAMDNDRGNEETNKTELHDGTSVVPYPAKAPEMIGQVIFNVGEKPDGAMDNGRGRFAMDHSSAQSGSTIVKHTGNIVPKHQQDGLKVLVNESFNPINPLVVEETVKGLNPNLAGQQDLDGVNLSSAKSDQELRDAAMEENIIGDLHPKKQFVEARHNDGSTIGDENSLNKSSTNSKPDQELRDAVMGKNTFGDLLPKEQVVEVKYNDGSSIEDENSLNKNSTYSKEDSELRDAIIEENILGDLLPNKQVVETRHNDGSAIEDENSPNETSTNFLHFGVSGYPVVGTKVDIHIEKPLKDDTDLSISIHNSSLLPDKKVTGTSDLKVVLENKDAGGGDTVIHIGDRPEFVALPSSRDVVETGAVQQTRQAEARGTNGLDIVKSIVYGGLIESITSLGIVSSAVGADAATLNIFALSIANLVGGIFLIIHNIWDLRAEHDATNTSTEATNTNVDGATSTLRKDRYLELLGCRENFWIQATVGILSFLIFGMIPPVTYGFSFRKSDDMDFKLAAVATASLLCIALLASGKAYIQRQPAKGYVKTVVYYIIMGFMASGISYVAGDLIKKLLEKLGLFESGEAAFNMSIIQTVPTETVGSSSY